MSRYPGRILSSTAPTVNANTAKGIWTLDEALRYSRAGQWPVPTGNGDPYFQYNTMLLPGQGTNGAQNNTFLDSSTNNFTITRNGNTTQGTFTPFSGTAGNWSNYFDGTGDYLTLPDSTALNLETGDFTIELWFYVTTSGVNNPLIYRFDGDASSRNELQFGIVYNSSGNLVFSAFQSTTNDDIPFTGVSINQWHHCALVRSGNNIYAYLDGVRNPTTRTLVGSLNNGGWQTWIGGYREGGTFQYLNGFISNVRILKGTALYTGSTYTVPTAPLTAITNTSLLTCQNNRFVDNSTNAFAITRNGDVAVTPFQPFGAPTSAYSASTVGGSGYFDGSGDYLTAASNAAFAYGTGDYTIEGWHYLTGSTSSLRYLFDQRISGSTLLAPAVYINSGQYVVYLNGAIPLQGGTVVGNGWVHWALVRSSGTTKLYINGTSIGSFADTGSHVTSQFRTGGEWSAGGSNDWQGYLADVRVVKGTAVYTANFTPPTAPLTAITNTSLLLSGTNAGIIDNAQDNNLETVGGAQISTTQYKWGASSMYFDGTGDWVLAPSSQNIAMGTGDFTIEFWMYLTGVSGEGTTVYNSTSGGINLFMSISSNWGIARSGVGVDNNFGTPPAQNQWNHIVVNRTASVIKAFINGNQVFAGANTSNYVAGPIQIGGSSFGTITGYIQDLRITKGYARYPYSFTPPTAALPLFYQAAATPSSDPYFDYTTLLLPGNGTNGANNNTFLDSSTNAFTITRNGNTTQGTFTAFSQTGWGNYFDGNGDFLTCPNNAAFDFASGDVTLEAWVYLNAISGSQTVVSAFATGGSGFTAWSLTVNASGYLLMDTWVSGTEQFITATSNPIPANQWTHVAYTRASGTSRLFVNGVSCSFSGSISQGINSGGNLTSIASSRYSGFEAYLNGYISNCRVVKGTAVYTSAFTPPTAPLTAISGTSLLTCQSNRFVDNSTNAFTLTANGNVSVQAFSPFNPTAAYSTSTVGGSGYFDGTGDYLSVSNNALIATGDFTMEAWCYTTRNNAYQGVISSGDSSNTAGARIVQINTGNVEFWVNGQVNNSTALPINQWNHVAIVRSGSGSNNISCYLNGTRLGQLTQTSTTSNNTVVVGRYYNNGTDQYHWLGYIADARFVVGSAVYSGATYTVPTAPLTAVTNTQLLLSGTNGGIIDNTAKNNLETVGGASISTTVSKFGGSSMYFDGSGDWLLMPAGDKFAFGTGDYTVEAWVYFTSITTTDLQIIFLSGSTGGNNFYFHVDGNQISVGTSAAFISNQATSFSTGTWYHVAACRYSGTLRLFVNGVQIGSSVSDTTNWISAGSARIGANESGTQTVFGYINDHRVTKGIARYTTNFTPPTTAFLTL